MNICQLSCTRIKFELHDICIIDCFCSPLDSSKFSMKYHVRDRQLNYFLSQNTCSSPLWQLFAKERIQQKTSLISQTHSWKHQIFKERNVDIGNHLSVKTPPPFRKTKSTKRDFFFNNNNRSLRKVVKYL